jgi:DNA-binding MarR family transcriptional regulator
MPNVKLCNCFDDICYNDYIQFVVNKASNQVKGTLEEEAFLAIAKTSEVLQGLVAEMLKEHGLSSTQYNALRILRGAEPQGLPCSEVGERMINRDPDITRLLNRLESRKLIVRRREEKDRRVIIARISPAGLVLLKSLDIPIREFHSRTLGHLGATRLKSMIRLLEAARQTPS